MLELLEIVLNGGEVKRSKHSVPESVDVNINIERMTKKEPNMAILDFTYQVDYKPDVALVKITGQAYCRDTPDNLKLAMAAHKKDGILPMEYGARAINMINANVGLNSIFLIRPFNLMPPFMPPMITTENPDLRKAKPKKK